MFGLRFQGARQPRSGSLASASRYFSASSRVRRPYTLPRYAKRTAYVGAVLGAAYFADRELYASTVTRNLRTLYTCGIIALDYKWNFTREKSESISALHERVGDRLLHLFSSNGGLYIKFGQAIGANAALLPKPIQSKFARLFDDAPRLPFNEIAAVIKAEFGRPPSGPDGLFAEFEETAMASASIAQVHRARLKYENGNPGPLVAVKIQKPAVSKQMEPDLFAFRAVMWMYENWFFDLPALFVVDFISDHLRQELDFENEARNGLRTASFIASDPALRDRVHIPKIYTDYTSKRILTTEWIDGVRLSDRAAIMSLMGDGRELPRPIMSSLAESPTAPSGEDQKRLKGGVKWIMQTMVDLFGAQIFRWGWVHCDPHPGNIMVREHPSRPNHPQLVLLDHGLYVRLHPDFQRQYAELWKGLLAADMRTVGRVAEEWGIGAPDLFASATLLRPIRRKLRLAGGEEEKLSQYELSMKMKMRMKEFLTDTDKLPKELVFIGRNMRIVQGNNQMFGSPVNRIKLTGYSAADSLTRTPNLTFRQRTNEYFHQTIFYTVMYSTDVLFWASHVKRWLWDSNANKGRGFEDQLEAQMAEMMKTEYGVEINPEMFDA
ncbi:ABC1-domain-containing protein [Amylostereum chailletii]|nr:ABC1-domain-containing protein [Amylostereum chailletii]